MRGFGVLLAAMVLVGHTAWADGGNPARGEAVYQRCLACHSLEHNRVGPRHCGLFGRRAGSLPGYAYSAAMRKYGVTWDEQTLDPFLQDPLNTVPGTRMGYAGVKDAGERADLIAWLKQATADPAICK